MVRLGGMTGSLLAAVPTELSIEVQPVFLAHGAGNQTGGLLPSATGLPVQAGGGLFSMW